MGRQGLTYYLLDRRSRGPRAPSDAHRFRQFLSLRPECDCLRRFSATPLGSAAKRFCGVCVYYRRKSYQERRHALASDRAPRTSPAPCWLFTRIRPVRSKTRPSMSVTFRAPLRIRGVECALRDKYAEAFYSRKLVCELKETRES
jgi:hypothetical protein